MYPSKPLYSSALPSPSSPLANMVFSNNSGDEKVYDMQDSSESKLLQREDNHEAPLPTPISTNAPKPKSKLSATVIIPIWIVLSSTVIIYNNYLYNTLNFKFPVFLVTFHLSFAVSFPRLRGYLTNMVTSTGDWHPCPAANDKPPRRDKRCPHDQGDVYSVHSAYRRPVLGKSYPQ